MALENEARAKMETNAGGAVDDNNQQRSLIEDAADRHMSSGVSSSSGSGGYRYAAIEQAMDASASGKRWTNCNCTIDAHGSHIVQPTSFLHARPTKLS